MAKRRKVHKGLRNQRGQATRQILPAIQKSSRKMSDEELECEQQRRKQAGVKGKSAREAREHEHKQRDRDDRW